MGVRLDQREASAGEMRGRQECGREPWRGSEDKCGYGRNTYASSLLQFADVGFCLSSVNKALLVASEKGQVDKVRQLITANTDVEARDEVTGTSMRTRNGHMLW